MDAIKDQIKKDAAAYGIVYAVTKHDYAISPDGEKLYSITGNVYSIGWDYYDEEGITDLNLISEY